MRMLLDNLPLLIGLILAAVIDVRQRRIPNWLTFGLIAAGMARCVVVGPAPSATHAIAGLLAAAAVPAILFIIGALGGGDVKLMASIGVWVGPRLGVTIFAAECVIGMALVLIQAASQRRTLALFRNTAVLTAVMAQQGITATGSQKGQQQSSIDRPLPFAVPAMLATFLVLYLSA
jgi:prepilin peptidase CpaA